MAQKRALVVDDSRSARVALQRLLEKQGIEVSFAESGEEAIDLLKHHEVDVIFMDHSMPGMDGFEAVSAIKAEPRTAMIPVMMYTAKEGEVYVGQARALGAVGVLPKQVQPGVLFEMLLKLGLVKDRRDGRRRRTGDVPPRSQEEDETDRLLERQALGMSIQALIKRILEDQHLELRSDVLASNRDFARRVAEEIHARQQADAELEKIETPPSSGLSGRHAALILLLGLLPAVLLFLSWSQASQQRDAALAENARLLQSAAQQSEQFESMRAELPGGGDGDGDEARAETDSGYRALVDTVEWAINHDNQFAHDASPFGDPQRERLSELLDRLAAIGFTGTVQLAAHLGEFCLTDDGAGGYRLADPDMPISDCTMLGHPMGGSAALRERLSVGFANFLATSPLLQDSGIQVLLVVHGSRDSVPRHAIPPGLRTAGEWNAIAALNNRIEFTLIPAQSPAQ